jgi:hypothetical protein
VHRVVAAEPGDGEEGGEAEGEEGELAEAAGAEDDGGGEEKGQGDGKAVVERGERDDEVGVGVEGAGGEGGEELPEEDEGGDLGGGEEEEAGEAGEREEFHGEGSVGPGYREHRGRGGQAESTGGVRESLQPRAERRSGIDCHDHAEELAREALGMCRRNSFTRRWLLGDKKCVRNFPGCPQLNFDGCRVILRFDLCNSIHN